MLSGSLALLLPPPAGAHTPPPNPPTCPPPVWLFQSLAASHAGSRPGPEGPESSEFWAQLNHQPSRQPSLLGSSWASVFSLPNGQKFSVSKGLGHSPSERPKCRFPRVENRISYEQPAQLYHSNLGFSVEVAVFCLSLSLKGQWGRT